ncbi:MAG: tRNA lysidine(34) synthetase [Christensenellales bacterium]
MKKTLGCIRRIDETYGLIEDNDKIVAGVSGGKDSLLLLKALSLYRYFCKKEYTLYAVTVDLGFGCDFSPVKEFCSQLGVEYRIVPTEIGKIVFEERKEKNPCALCAKMRRGALHEAALEMGCKKVALGHSADDAMETFFLSLFYEGRLNTLPPVHYLDKSGVTLIRPLLYLPEKDVIAAAKLEKLPIVKNPCPANGFTKRQDMKELLRDINLRWPGARQQMLRALANYRGYNLWAPSQLIREPLCIAEEERDTP